MTKPNLAEFAEHLALLRNREHRAHAETPRDPFNGYERGIHLGNASAYTLALSLLHTYTDGQYGTPLHHQPDIMARPVDPEEVAR